MNVNFFGNFMIFYHMKSILKDPAHETMEVHSSLVFYEKNSEKQENTIFGYKKWSKFGFGNIL